jgi:chromate transporter
MPLSTEVAKPATRTTPTAAQQVDQAGNSPAEQLGGQNTSLPRLLLLFLWLGSISVGGWTTPYLFDEMVRRRRWLSAERFVEIDTLSRLLPGAKGPNVAVFLVQALRGPLAAALCLAAFVLPGTVLILLASAFLFGAERAAWLNGGLRGIYLAALALIVTTCLRMLPSIRGARFGVVLAGLAFVASGPLGLELLVVLLVLGLLSLALNRPEG